MIHKAVANPNIALIKYWGKVNEQLNLPATASISMTLDIFPTTTTVEISENLNQDQVSLNDKVASESFSVAVSRFLDLVRTRAGTESRAIVQTHNSVPTAAGLASSASGFAALALAASKAYGLELNPSQLSALARRGSGSASRSIFPGYAIWNLGEDDTSFARPLPKPQLELALVVVVLNAREKKISSRAAMNLTRDTSPFYDAWLASSKRDLQDFQTAFTGNNFTAIGQIVERNALRMHATSLGANPPVRYLSAESFAVLDYLEELRGQGLAGYATMDAGPNVKVLCQSTQRQELQRILAERFAHANVYTCRPGLGARYESC